MQTFSEWLEARLADLDWTRSDLDRASGVADGVISRWFTDPSRRPSPASLAKIAPPLGVPYADLMQMCGYLPGTPPPPRPVQPEVQARLSRVGETLSRYPLAFQQAVLNALEAMAAAGEALQAPTNAPALSQNNHQKRELAGGIERRKRNLTARYLRFLHHFFPLSLAFTQP